MRVTCLVCGGRVTSLVWEEDEFAGPVRGDEAVIAMRRRPYRLVPCGHGEGYKMEHVRG